MNLKVEDKYQNAIVKFPKNAEDFLRPLDDNILKCCQSINKFSENTFVACLGYIFFFYSKISTGFYKNDL